jgi:hypothetical protein
MVARKVRQSKAVVGVSTAQWQCARDASLCIKNCFAQDDADDSVKLKPNHSPLLQ